MGRSKPAKPNTLAVLDKAENRLKDWAGLRVKDLTGNEILRKFDEIASRARTAAEHWTYNVKHFHRSKGGSQKKNCIIYSFYYSPLLLYCFVITIADEVRIK